MLKKITFYFLHVLFLFSLTINAQVFPVNVTPQVIPPYSLKLSEYSTSGSEKLLLNLLLTDITESNRQVRLKFFLENNAGLSVQSSDVVIGANPIFLDGGVPLRLSNIDLRAYFELQNLRGINPRQYSVPLKEGLYRFCFEVYDALSNRQISRKSCTAVYLVLNDPPFLNTPRRGEQVLVRDPQNIVFDWTPRHLNATNVEYEFIISELWDTQMDPQAAFLASRPLYQTKTRATTLLYGPAEPQLLPDKMYGWRVRASVSDGISETSVFKNDGFSEIHHFTYTGSCAEPAYVLAEAKNPTAEKIMWQGVNHIRYNVEYRKKGAESSTWFEGGTINEYTNIYNLEPGTTYEFRVGGQCLDNGPFTYSQIYEFTTTLANDEEESTYNCGITPEIIIKNEDPLPQLGVNETFTAGDFPVTIREVNGGNGTFSGWGFIVVPYLQDTKIKVSFDNVKINTEYQLIDGIVVTDYDEDWGGVDDIQDEIDALLSLGDAIVEALNLDISRTTKERVNQVVQSIVGQVDNENLPDDIKDNISNAANEMNTASEAYNQAREIYENEDSTEEEKEEARRQMDEAENEFNEAQDNLKEANEAADKFKKDVADLLKKAIYDLYREGRDNEDALFSNVEAKTKEIQVISSEEANDSTPDIEDDDIDIVFSQDSQSTSNTVEEFYKEEEKLGVYLFAKLLSEDSTDEKALDGFIKEAKSFSIDLIEIIRNGSSENKSNDEIKEELKTQLRVAFINILVKYSY